MKTKNAPAIQKDYDRVEREAATAIGYILFEFTQLDMELGLYLCWSDHSVGVEELTKKVNDMNFNLRINLLKVKVQEKFSGALNIVKKYDEWINDAHGIRELRNELFHGRWGFDLQRQSAANVVGLPTSPLQKSRLFTIAELLDHKDSIRQLRSRLADLRKSNPV
ncbi:MAG: hypothetical protein R3F50_08135 [Gammaproteobacteria bacterium]